MHRFFLPGQLAEGPAQLSGAEAHHLRAVLRGRVGDLVGLVNGEGREAQARIVNLGKQSVELEIEWSREQPPRFPQVTLASAVPKGERFAWLVEKAVELGVSRLIPLITERSVVDPGDSKLDKLRQTVIEACKQSGQARFMAIEKPCAWQSFLHQRNREVPLFVAHPTGERLSLAVQRATSVELAVGPEGGFSPAEIEAAVAARAHPVSLGPAILRVETAGLALAAWWMLGIR